MAPETLSSGFLYPPLELFCWFCFGLRPGLQSLVKGGGDLPALPWAAHTLSSALIIRLWTHGRAVTPKANMARPHPQTQDGLPLPGLEITAGLRTWACGPEALSVLKIHGRPPWGLCPVSHRHAAAVRASTVSCHLLCPLRALLLPDLPSMASLALSTQDVESPAS